MDEVRREMGDRVYGSSLAFGLAVGLIVLLVLRAVIGQ